MKDSLITADRFDSDSQVEKPEVESAIANNIYYWKKTSLRQDGGPIVCLVGPGMRRHLTLWARNLGRYGKFYVPEKVEWVHAHQKKSLCEVKDKKRIVLSNRDFFEVADVAVRDTHNQCIILDYDSCRTFSAQVYEEHLLEKLDLLARTIQSKPIPQLNDVWMTATFSKRKERLGMEQIAQILIKIWEDNGFISDIKGIYPYREKRKCPMFEILLRASR